MWPRHFKSKSIVVLLRRNVVLGKNAFSGGGKCAATQITSLVVILIYVRICCIGANELAAKRAGVRATMREGVIDFVNLCAAVLAGIGAGVKTNVSAGGILGVANTAKLGACIFKIVRISGVIAANVTDATSLSSGCYVLGFNGSGFAALVTGGVAIAVIRMSNGLAFNNDRLTAVLANGAANCLGRVCYCIALADNSVACGAALCIAGEVASSRIGVRSNGLAATLYNADTVAILRFVVVAGVLANCFTSLDIANEISVCIGVINRFGRAASIASLCIAGTLPKVLLRSLVAATVIADLVTSVGIKVIGILSHKTADAAGGAASELKVVFICGDNARTAAVDTRNGAILLVFVAGLTGLAAVSTSGGAGMKPCVSEIALGSLFTANVTVNIAGVVVGVDNAGSRLITDLADGGASLLIRMLQLGASCFARVADGVASVVVGVLQSVDRGGAGRADGAVTSGTGVWYRALSFNGLRAAIAKRITWRRVRVLLGAGAGCECKQCGHNQK